MVKEGIILGHHILEKGIEVDQDKVEVIERLLPPIYVKGVRIFLGHAGLYWRFIKDFFKNCTPFCAYFLRGNVSSISMSTVRKHLES